jgi:hypothetical protein
MRFAFQASVQRFKEVLLENNRPTDPIPPKSPALAARKKGDVHPVVVGRAAYPDVSRHDGSCTAVNLARRRV